LASKQENRVGKEEPGIKHNSEVLRLRDLGVINQFNGAKGHLRKSEENLSLDRANRPPSLAFV
jgi:hypothetical protein